MRDKPPETENADNPAGAKTAEEGRTFKRERGKICRVPVALPKETRTALEELAQAACIPEEAALSRALLHEDPQEGVLADADAVLEFHRFRVQELQRKDCKMEDLLANAGKKAEEETEA